MTEPSTTTDPRIEAGAKAWDKYMGGRYAPNEVEELSEEVAVILAAADAVDPRKPRTITTVEELDALPNGSAILDSSGDVAQKLGGWWHFPETSRMGPSKVLKYSSTVTVIHEPDAEAAR